MKEQGLYRNMTTILKKNNIIEIDITDMGVNGEGVGRYDGFAFFVKDALYGDRVKAVVTKVNAGYGFAKTLEILKLSEFRTEPPCPIAGKCGGCQIMPLAYPEQLKLKERKVKKDLESIGGVSFSEEGALFEPIIGMDIPEGGCPVRYRNKVQLPVGLSRDGSPLMGFYAGRTHFVIDADGCPVAFSEADTLMKVIRSFIEEKKLPVYDENTGRGLIRHVLMRKGFATGQIMVCLVINGESLSKYSPGADEDFVKTLLDTGLNIASVCLNINKARTNVILGNRIKLLSGNAYIEDKIGDLTFRISPLSFFQVNSVQTEKLYGKALAYAGLTGNETVWDLYCGIGTISLFLSQRAKKVCGVEIVPAAIENANENAAINGIKNAEFFCGKSEEVFPAMLSEDADFAADVVVLDPPRKGCDSALLEAILKVEPERIVYVSCNSATLARDIKILGEKYKAKKVAACDMFPHSVHAETVVLLSHKKADSYIHVDVEFGEGEGKIPVDKIVQRAEKYKPKEKVTYKKIKEYIVEKYGFQVHTAYIAEVKRSLGLPMYDAPNAVEELKQLRKHPTLEKVEAIKDALRYFAVI